MPEKVFGRGAEGDRQVLPQKLLSMRQVQQIACHRRLFRERQQLLLRGRLPEDLRHEVRRLPELCRGRGGLDDGQHVPPEVLHLHQLQPALRVWQQGN